VRHIAGYASAKPANKGARVSAVVKGKRGEAERHDKERPGEEKCWPEIIEQIAGLGKWGGR